MTETQLTITKRIDENVKAILKILTPVPSPTPNKKYVVVDVINWGNLNNLPVPDASELTYFVLPVGSNGVLMDTSTIIESKFVSDIHSQGKKATFSIAGGGNNLIDITNAVNQKINLINSIVNHVTSLGYDGVTLDVEGTNVDPQAMVDFINLLRTTLGPDKVIGCYVQPYQLSTVWSKLDQAINSLTWVSPMMYDFPNTVEEFKTFTLKWLTKVPKDKLLAGAAINYDATGLDIVEFPLILDWINEQGLKGIGLWEHSKYTQDYKTIIHNKFLNI